MNPSQIVFPVCLCRTQNGRQDPFLEYGTAFYIGNNIFVTAGHSLAEPSNSAGAIHIGLPLRQSSDVRTEMVFIPFANTERHEECDLGLASVIEDIAKSFPLVAPLKWHFGAVPYFNFVCDVIAPGFPHALHTKQDFDALTSRVYRGNLVGTAPHQLDKSKSPIIIYELSFQVPIGLSGAPVIALQTGTVLGHAIGMKETGVRLEVTKESEKEGDRLEVYTTMQMQHYGVAIPSLATGEIGSALLGRTLRDYLTKTGLV